jgi:hypothetical protein
MGGEMQLEFSTAANWVDELVTRFSSLQGGGDKKSAEAIGFSHFTIITFLPQCAQTSKRKKNI